MLRTGHFVIAQCSTSSRRFSSTPWLPQAERYRASRANVGCRYVDVSRIAPLNLSSRRGQSSHLGILPSSLLSRPFSHLANKSDQQQSSVKDVQPSIKDAKKPVAQADATPASAHNPGGKEQRMQDMQIIRRLLPNIWPKGDTSTKTRVLIALGLLVGGKVSNGSNARDVRSIRGAWSEEGKLRSS